MKKVVLLSLCFLMLGVASNATIHMITAGAGGLVFSPSVIDSVYVGDTIKWMRVSGSHTTTCDPANEPATSLPPGAATWDAPLSAGSPTFMYIPSVTGHYHYVCSPHQGAGMQGDFTVYQRILPVMLTAVQLSGSGENVNVKWSTETEQNTDHFVIRRSANGAGFQDVATVPAAGSSNSVRNYTYTDKISARQKYAYYTVTAVDKDGRKAQSAISVYKNTDALVRLIASVGPNPISRGGNVTLSFNADRSGQMDVRIINQEGKVVNASKLQANAGINSAQLQLGNLSAGTYTVMCTLNGVSESYKVVCR